MSLQKVVFSIFLSGEKVYRVSLNKFVVLLLGIILIAPYVYLISSYSVSPVPQNDVKKSETRVKALEAAPVVNPVISKAVIVKKPLQQNVKEVLVADYKITNIQISNEGKWLDVNFLLGKKIPSIQASNGVIFLDAIDKDSNVIATSEKSVFKFSSARFSKFRLSIPENVKAQKINVKIISRSSTSSGLDPKEDVFSQVISL